MDILDLAEQFKQGKRFITLFDDGTAEMSSTRAEAGSKLKGRLGIAFELRTLTSGSYRRQDYEEDDPMPESPQSDVEEPRQESMPYRKVGLPIR